MFDLILPELDDTLLLDMAKCDVPFPEAVEGNLNALRQIIETRIVAGKLDWHPGEVCNLLRWDRSTANRANNIMGLFGGWILVNAYAQPESEAGIVEDGDEHTLVRMLEIVMAMGNPHLQAASQLLCWAYLSIIEHGNHRTPERLLYLLAILLLNLYDHENQHDKPLQQLADYLIAQEAAIRLTHASPAVRATPSPPGHAWVLGMDVYSFDMCGMHERWTHIVRQVAQSPQIQRSAATKSIIDDIVDRLSF